MMIESKVDLWYSDEDASAHLIELRGKGKTLARGNDLVIARINVSDWQAPAEKKDTDIFRRQFETPEDWKCRRAAEEFDPWLEEVPTKEAARILWMGCGE